jgi:hypothetical protein
LLQKETHFATEKTLCEKETFFWTEKTLCEIKETHFATEKTLCVFFSFTFNGQNYRQFGIAFFCAGKFGLLTNFVLLSFLCTYIFCQFVGFGFWIGE